MAWLMRITDWSAVIAGAVIACAIFLAGTALGIVFTGVLLVKMPANYFRDDGMRDIWADRHPAIRVARRVLKNLLGALLVVAGFGLSLPLIPGPGLLLILFGLTLLDLPGKRQLERWLIGRPAVLRAINRLRQRCGKPPIVLGSANRSDELKPTNRILGGRKQPYRG